MVVFLLWNIATRPECTLNGSKWDLKKRFFLLRFSQFTRRRRRKQKPKKKREMEKQVIFLASLQIPTVFFFTIQKKRVRKKKLRKGRKKGMMRLDGRRLQ